MKSPWFLGLFGACLVASAGSVLAQESLTGEEFQALTEGRVFYYAQGGIRYGQEAYDPGGAVRWFLFGRPAEDACVHGRWWAEAGQICFVYEDEPETTHCWEFRANGPVIEGQYRAGADWVEGYTIEETTDPLPCRGPFLGARYEAGDGGG